MEQEPRPHETASLDDKLGGHGGGAKRNQPGPTWPAALHAHHSPSLSGTGPLRLRLPLPIALHPPDLAAQRDPLQDRQGNCSLMKG